MALYQVVDAGGKAAGRADVTGIAANGGETTAIDGIVGGGGATAGGWALVVGGRGRTTALGGAGGGGGGGTIASAFVSPPETGIRAMGEEVVEGFETRANAAATTSAPAWCAVLKLSVFLPVIQVGVVVVTVAVDVVAAAVEDIRGGWHAGPGMENRGEDAPMPPPPPSRGGGLRNGVRWARAGVGIEAASVIVVPPPPALVRDGRGGGNGSRCTLPRERPLGAMVFDEAGSETPSAGADEGSEDSTDAIA